MGITRSSQANRPYSHSLRFIVALTALVVVFHLFVEAAAAVPEQPSHVYIEGRELIVERRLEDGSLTDAESYVIHGITWTPATRAPKDGPNPLNPSEAVPYGFFIDWANRDPQGNVLFVHWLRAEHQRHYRVDVPLMKMMNVNTVRLYIDFGDNPDTYKEILDVFYRNDIMVIMMVASSKNDIDARRYENIVNICKGHPAILMWNIGNEWNLDYNKYWGYETVEEAARATNSVAEKIKKLDGAHPVASCLGDRFMDDEPSNTIKDVVDMCADVDIWGLNIYRGKSFRNLFLQWSAITDKPMYLSEFGIDSFKTTAYTKADGARVAFCKGSQDRDTQAEYDLSLWSEIGDNLSAYDPEKVCVGGTIHSFNDCLWKVGCYHASLGGLIDYDDPVEGVSYKTYNNEGFYLPDGAQDGILNEEHFGVMDADRNPKKAFLVLRDLYEVMHNKQARGKRIKNVGRLHAIPSQD
ncbi:MAG: glycoside hydrolase family 2 TIM barrel-domain containing protein [Candidatus Omnitrophota bacterium]